MVENLKNTQIVLEVLSSVQHTVCAHTVCAHTVCAHTVALKLGTMHSGFCTMYVAVPEIYYQREFEPVSKKRHQGSLLP